MRLLTIIFGSVVFCAFIAASIAAFLDQSSGDATNAVLLAAAAGVGLGFLVHATAPSDTRRL
jgi:hypothetical protein